MFSLEESGRSVAESTAIVLGYDLRENTAFTVVGNLGARLLAAT